MPKDNKKKPAPKKPLWLYGRRPVGGIQSVWLGFCRKPRCILSFEYGQVNEMGYPVHKDGSLYEPFEVVHAIQEGSIAVYCFCCLPGKAWTVTAAGSNYSGMSFIGCKSNNCPFKLALDNIYNWGPEKLKMFCYQNSLSAPPVEPRPENASTFGSRLAYYAGLSTPNWMASTPSQPQVNSPMSTRTTASPPKGKRRKVEGESDCDNEGKGKVKQEDKSVEDNADEDKDGYVTFTTEDQSMIYYGPSSGLIDWIDNVKASRDSPEGRSSHDNEWDGGTFNGPFVYTPL
ncbi:hypothetical protein AAF712_015019 [Marasmius tenuissimus]|uniref:Uncharacterized protein n=1 Tax=Marasmius tenuissimus TaxID=585030 RepID=A0ABR2ZAG7_9AGAR